MWQKIKNIFRTFNKIAQNQFFLKRNDISIEIVWKCLHKNLLIIVRNMINKSYGYDYKKCVTYRIVIKILPFTN